jgi:lipopolysaccharide biosynthesis regulator YciM
MIYLLLFLIPIVALLGWAARLDWTRRQREISGHDTNTAAYAVRQDTERKKTEWTIGL